LAGRCKAAGRRGRGGAGGGRGAAGGWSCSRASSRRLSGVGWWERTDWSDGAGGGGSCCAVAVQEKQPLLLTSPPAFKNGVEAPPLARPLCPAAPARRLLGQTVTVTSLLLALALTDLTFARAPAPTWPGLLLPRPPCPGPTAGGRKYRRPWPLQCPQDIVSREGLTRERACDLQANPSLGTTPHPTRII